MRGRRRALTGTARRGSLSGIVGGELIESKKKRNKKRNPSCELYVHFVEQEDFRCSAHSGTDLLPCMCL